MHFDSGLGEFEDETPHNMGDLEYPMRPAFVEPLQSAAIRKEKVAAWRASTGPLVKANADIPAYASLGRMCSEAYGVGRCMNRFAPETRAAFDRYMKDLQGLASIARGAEDLPIFSFTEDGGSFIVVISIFALLRDPAVHLFFHLRTQDGIPPTPGSILSIEAGGPESCGGLAFVPDVELAKFMTQKEGPWMTKRVKYVPIVGDLTLDGKVPVAFRVEQVSTIHLRRHQKPILFS